MAVPKDAKLIFTAGFDSVAWPYVYARFRSTDLYGVILSKNTCSFEEAPVSQVIRSLALQDNLRILAINYVSLTPKAWQAITRMESIRCLDLSHIWINSVLLTGSQLARFTALPKLQVLKFDDCSNVTQLLEALARGNSLKWLSIANTGCNDADVQLIGQLHDLEFLNLRGAKVNGEKLLDVLATMKSLRQVIVDPAVLADVDEARLKSFRGPQLVIDQTKGTKSIKGTVLEQLKTVSDKKGVKKDDQELPDEEWYQYFKDDGN